MGIKCKRCGGEMDLTPGWVPTYSNPDNSGWAPSAEPYCPVCDADFYRENFGDPPAPPQA